MVCVTLYVTHVQLLATFTYRLFDEFVAKYGTSCRDSYQIVVKHS